jgi:hypothetical protein
VERAGAAARVARSRVQRWPHDSQKTGCIRSALRHRSWRCTDLRLPRANKRRWTGARAFEEGAVGFLLKPFSDTLLLSVEAAFRTT